MADSTERIVVLESYYEPLAAHLARTRLAAAGIPCFLTNENLISLNRFYSPVAGGVRLHVYARDVAQAIEMLRPAPVMEIVREPGLPRPATAPPRDSQGLAWWKRWLARLFPGR